MDTSLPTWHGTVKVMGCSVEERAPKLAKTDPPTGMVMATVFWNALSVIYFQENKVLFHQSNAPAHSLRLWQKNCLIYAMNFFRYSILSDVAFSDYYCLPTWRSILLERNLLVKLRSYCQNVCKIWSLR